MLVRPDNSVVTLPTTCENLEISTVARRCKQRKGKVQIPQLAVFGLMSLIRLFITIYRTGMRERKWWWPIFIYLFDVSLPNAWSLNRKLFPKEESVAQLLKFRIKLALTLLKNCGQSYHQGKSIPKPLPYVHENTTNHLPTENGNGRRCTNCPGKAKIVCSECKVGLHPRWCEEYHK